MNCPYSRNVRSLSKVRPPGDRHDGLVKGGQIDLEPAIAMGHEHPVETSLLERRMRLGRSASLRT
jgi:predicted metal-dependent peptidase